MTLVLDFVELSLRIRVQILGLVLLLLGPTLLIGRGTLVENRGIVLASIGGGKKSSIRMSPDLPPSIPRAVLVLLVMLLLLLLLDLSWTWR